MGAPTAARLRTWFEIHHAGEVWYCPTVTDLAAFLAERHIDPAQLAPPDGASPDGCE